MGQLIRAEWKDELIARSNDAAIQAGLHSATARFLEDVGLPERASDGAMLVIDFFSTGQFGIDRSHGGAGLQIGVVDGERSLVIRSRDGFVFISGSEAGFFLNSSLPAVLGCMAMYHREFILQPEDEGESEYWGDPEEIGTAVTRARAQRLRDRLNQLDGKALDVTLGDQDGVTYWGFVVEEIEAGII